MTENNEISILDKKEKLVVVSDSASVYFDTARLEHAYRAATMLAASTMVPKHFQGQVSNCLIALNMAGKFNLDPLMVMLKMPIVKDKPTMEGQLLIALVNAQMPFDTKLKFEIEDAENLSDMKCTCWALDEGERIEYSLTVGDATKIGQAGSNPNWKNKGSAKLMLMYRTATYLVRTHAPEVLLGYYTTDEVQDMGQMIDATPSSAAAIVEELSKEVDAEVIAPEKKSGGAKEKPQKASPSESKAPTSGEQSIGGQKRSPELDELAAENEAASQSTLVEVELPLETNQQDIVPAFLNQPTKE